MKWYNPDKGFGFIVRDRGGKDIFVHASALNRAGISELAEGQRVAVDMIEGGKGISPLPPVALHRDYDSLVVSG